MAKPFRGARTCVLLMYAALRWLEKRGATRVVGIGRREVMNLYEKAGFTALDREIVSEAVRAELMMAELPAARWRFRLACRRRDEPNVP